MQANDLRRGMIIMHNGELHVVKETMHLTPGNLRAMVQAKLMNFKNGKIFQERFRSTEEVQDAFVSNRNMQYLYKDESGYVFMDSANFEQVSISADLVGDAGKFLTDNLEVRVSFHEEQAIAVVLPASVVSKVVFAPPGDKGDSVSSILKQAKVELGFEVGVPLFVKQGDKIRISTEDGSYVSKEN
jgi:elongation factor P